MILHVNIIQNTARCILQQQQQQQQQFRLKTKIINFKWVWYLNMHYINNYIIVLLSGTAKHILLFKKKNILMAVVWSLLP